METEDYERAQEVAGRVKQITLELWPLQCQVPVSAELLRSAETKMVADLVARDVILFYQRMLVPASTHVVQTIRTPKTWRDHVRHEANEIQVGGELRWWVPLLFQLFRIPDVAAYEVHNLQVVHVCPHIDVDIKGARDRQRMEHFIWMKDGPGKEG